MKKIYYENFSEVEDFLNNNKDYYIIEYFNVGECNYVIVSNETVTIESTWEEKIDNKISILEGEQETQNEEILNNMIATTEVFEMILTISNPTTLDTKNIKIGGNSMVTVYVTLILKGAKTIEDVPSVIRPQVQEQLDLLLK